MAPSYEFFCRLCNTKFEEYQKTMTSKSSAMCPKCGKVTNNRLIGTGGGIIWRGDGFYANSWKEDVRNGKQKK